MKYKCIYYYVIVISRDLENQVFIEIPCQLNFFLINAAQRLLHFTSMNVCMTGYDNYTKEKR